MCMIITPKNSEQHVRELISRFQRSNSPTCIVTSGHVTPQAIPQLLVGAPCAPAPLGEARGFDLEPPLVLGIRPVSGGAAGLGDVTRDKPPSRDGQAPAIQALAPQRGGSGSLLPSQPAKERNHTLPGESASRHQRVKDTHTHTSHALFCAARKSRFSGAGRPAGRGFPGAEL
jgi:hypothetical protein